MCGLSIQKGSRRKSADLHEYLFQNSSKASHNFSSEYISIYKISKLSNISPIYAEWIFLP